VLEIETNLTPTVYRTGEIVEVRISQGVARARTNTIHALISVVERIVELTANGQSVPLGESEGALHLHVPELKARCLDRIPAYVTQAGGRDNEVELVWVNRNAHNCHVVASDRVLDFEERARGAGDAKVGIRSVHCRGIQRGGWVPQVGSVVCAAAVEVVVDACGHGLRTARRERRRSRRLPVPRD